MKKVNLVAVMALVGTFLFSACSPKNDKEKKSMSSLKKETVTTAKDSLMAKFGKTDEIRITKGVDQAAEMWRMEDGADSTFIRFCMDNFTATGPDLDTLFDKYNYYFEQIYGHYNMMTIELMRNIHEPRGTVMPVDEMFGSWDVTAHFAEDMFNNKTAFAVLLNFPYYTLQEKNNLGKKWTARQWGMARLGDMFIARAPSDLLLKASETMVNGDSYISNYNIFMGSLLNEKGEKYFPEDKVLITHWGLRDELKSNYADTTLGLAKQEMIYQVMQRIIDQSIPQIVINNGAALWNPVTNKVTENGKEVASDPEPDMRYQVLLNNFKALKELDPYYPYNENYISRKFDAEMEMAQADVENLFVSYVSSPVLKEIGLLIEQRLGRKLRPFDIWYNGFTSRAGLNEAALDMVTQKLYPDNIALKKALPSLLKKLGFDAEKAQYIASFIDVDPAIGSGHAWGSAMQKDVSHLRTRIAPTGMNYKGYNIAVHEFGHNVEQTISLHDVDNYMLHGVPNTAFTEALAFVFQSRDLQLLDMKNNDPLAHEYENLEIAWSVYEIMGVSLVDMNVWKWMYENPDATPKELKEQVILIAKDIWNKYYAPVFGVKDQTILAVYSHMIDAPLYLSAYPIGHLIQFQLEQHLKGKDFAAEVLRIYSLGRLTPDAWMVMATGSKLSSDPLLKAASESAKVVSAAK
ncbi:MAG: hypothetical protein RB294_03845 [Bacteroidales bacterium]|jgi:hypothetical protein|nr:hypothetical protein [Bacteroidales bacterium]